MKTNFLKVSKQGDEYYTTEKDCIIIAENLIEDLKIWCPFDDENSYFPKVLRSHGYDVVNTYTDFFITEPPTGCNAIVSNPPFSRKREVVKRCAELNLKFALILPVLFVSDGYPFEFCDQLMVFRKRMKFYTDHERQTLQKRPRMNCMVVSNGLFKQNFIIVNGGEYE